MSRLRFSLLALLTVFAIGAGCKDDKQPETITVDPSALRPSKIRHDELPPDLVARITKLQRTFQEVHPSPLSEWLDDFKRDTHPEREVEIFEAMARAYTAFCRDRQLSLDAKREVYGVVIQRSAASDAEVLANARVTAITIEDVKTILKLYDMAPKPITVMPAPE